MFCIIFLSICIIVVAACLIKYVYDEDKDSLHTFALFVIVAFAITIIVINANNPAAISVYRGETTLKYTIVDGVPVDSVVVFKKKQL